MTRPWLCCAAIAAASAIAIPSVSAQPAPAEPVDGRGMTPAGGRRGPIDKSKAKTAKQYVEAGLAAQKAGDYDTALTMYQKAYDLVPHPVLIFNMAQANRLAGRGEEALAQYNKYLAAEPNSAQAQTAREFVAELTARKAELDAAQAEAAKAEAAKTAAKAEPARTPEAAPAPAPAPAPMEPPPPAETDHGRRLRLVGISAGAVGVVGVGIGIGFALHGKSLQSDVEKQYDPSTVDAGHRANTLALVGAIAGGALIATGVTLYLVGHRRGSGHESGEHVALAPLVSNEAAGLVLSGAWQ